MGPQLLGRVPDGWGCPLKWATDLLMLLTLAKVFWEYAEPRLIPAQTFVTGALGLAFLLGLAGAIGRDVLRNGLALTVLILFFYASLQAGLRSAHLAFATVLVALYLFGRIVSFSRWVILASKPEVEDRVKQHMRQILDPVPNLAFSADRQQPPS